MKITDLICELNEILERSGDVEVEVAVTSSPTDYCRGKVIATTDYRNGVSCVIQAIGNENSY